MTTLDNSRATYRLAGAATLRRLFLCLAAGLLLGLVLSGTWIYVAERAQSGPETFELTIPAGTGERLAAGGTAPSIPSRLQFREGDRFVVHNNDTVIHQLGATSIAPGTSVDVPLGASAFRSQFVCSFHSAGQIDLDVAAREPPMSLLIASLIVGLPLGLATFGVTWVVGKL